MATEVEVTGAVLGQGPDLEVLAKLEFPIVQYEVARSKIGEYVAAIGDRNPLHNDPLAAQKAGYRDVIAPPTFAAVFAMLPFRRALSDPEWVARSTIDSAKILHGEQSFEFNRPIVPGDRLLVQCIVSDVERKRSRVFLQVSMRVDDERGERVLDGTMTLVLRP